MAASSIIAASSSTSLKRTSWGYATNPNMGGVVMVGLGCEGFQIPRFKEAYGVEESETFRTMTIQETGGTKKTVAAGVEAGEGHAAHRQCGQAGDAAGVRTVLALQCGGSDGYSGITANPALGAAVDILVRHGGTAILSETPEIYGAEHLLTRRAATREVGEKLVEIIQWWEDYASRNLMEMNNNPSPGNKLGGLTTILEKSLGAAAKGGTDHLERRLSLCRAGDGKGFRVHGYAGLRPGLGHGPGGRRRQHPVLHHRPRLRLRLQADAVDQARHQHADATERMIDDMDINCGDILDGVSIAEKGAGNLRRHPQGGVRRERPSRKLLGYGDNEFVPWQIGAVM